MWLRQLKVVVWKNTIIRRRHWFLTLVEGFMPILLFLLVAYGRSKITSLQKVQIENPTLPAPQVLDSDSQIDIGSTYIYFAPNKAFQQDIMKRVQISLQMETNRIRGFNSEDDLMEHWAKNKSNTVYVILFKGNDPKHLDYSLGIYDHTNWDTGELYQSQLLFQPDQGSEYFWKGFISLQYEIDKAFIEAQGNKIGVKVLLGEFPFPPYNRDSGISHMFVMFLPLMTIFSFILICPATIMRVVEEKETGTKELMKMVGMKNWMLWLGWFIHGMIPAFLSCLCITILMKVKFGDTPYPPIEYSEGTVLFFFFLLYCMASVTFCFAISTFFSNPSVAMVVGILAWLFSFFIPKYVSESRQMSFLRKIMLCLFPNGALNFGFNAISLYEERELGVQWSNIYKSPTESSNDITLLNVLIMFVVDMILYYALTRYIENVNPGPYGVKKSVLYPFINLRNLIRGYRKHPKINAETANLNTIEEGAPLNVGISLQNVSKYYMNHLAVNNLSMDIYSDRITVLLGHNGAGKSTTMGMITGMISPTSGSIRINGKDIREDIEGVRQELGLCPQHNLLFTDLTVMEHLRFFAMLKGLDCAEAKKQARQLMYSMNIENKANEMAHTLSGGMKRKLCLGMAVIGDSKILVLDEPSSGMDPESRRELWDLLLSWRRSKTVLITTHFMEEADALGDRIAIMAQGKLLCYDTPMKLKEQYDTGYHVSLIIEDDDNLTDIAEEIRQCIINQGIADVKINSIWGNNVTYVLPINDKAKFAPVFELLENSKDHFKINNMSVTITTLEDVFLKTTAYADKELDRVDGKTRPERQLSKESNLAKADGQEQIFKGLLFKRLYYFQKMFSRYLILLLICLVIFSLSIYLSQDSQSSSSSEHNEMALNLTKYGKSKIYLGGGSNTNPQLDKLLSTYKNLLSSQRVDSEMVSDVQKAIIDRGTENIAFYKYQMVVAAEFKETKMGLVAEALYNAFALHSAPISLNLVMNALAKAQDDSLSIMTSLKPLLRNANAFLSMKELDETQVAAIWLLLIPIGVLFVIGYFIIFPHSEISTGLTHILYMSGVSRYKYWITNFAFDLVLYSFGMGFVLFVTVGYSHFFDWKLDSAHDIGAFYTILLVYGCMAIPFSYLFSRRRSVSGAFALHLILGMFLGVVLALIVAVLLESQNNSLITWGKFLKIVSLILLPNFGLSLNCVYFCQKVVEKYNWQIMAKVKRDVICLVEKKPCCNMDSKLCELDKNLFLSEESTLGHDLGLMMIGMVLYLALNIFLDTYLFKKLVTLFYKHVLGHVYKLKNIYKQTRSKAFQNVNSSLLEMDSNEVECLSAKKLQKEYNGVPVVSGISFDVKEGECFGLLGVNGAGKTTTFRLLTRQEAGDGEVCIYKDRKVEGEEYLKSLGYCPQFDALNFVLTGRQLLEVVALIRGIKEVDKEVEVCLKLFDLESYADKPCGTYSGGNKRKLSMAISLIGLPKYVLLDEPTSGVDPQSRRKFWDIIKTVQRSNQVSFILTSHSMLECEVLCNTLGIMKGGTIKRKNTISKLKEEMKGYIITVKLNKPKESVDVVDGKEISEDDNSFYKDKFEAFFKEKGYSDLKIRDEHSGLLQYEVSESGRRWSALFKQLEEAKTIYPWIEDYTISDVSLEDVFMDVARKD